MDNGIILGIVAVIVVLAGVYIYRAKKRGQKCIGCPYAASCASQKEGACACHGNGDCAEPNE